MYLALKCTGLRPARALEEKFQICYPALLRNIVVPNQTDGSSAWKGSMKIYRKFHDGHMKVQNAPH